MTSVVPGGPAAQAGLQAGDVIATINGRPATSVDQIAAITFAQRPGQTVSIGYERDGKSATTAVALGSEPGT